MGLDSFTVSKTVPPAWWFEAMATNYVVPLPGPAAGSNKWGDDGAMVQTKDGPIHARMGDIIFRDDDGTLAVYRQPDAPA